MKGRTITAFVGAALMLDACATKHYGRLKPLTRYESTAYSCRDIQIELAKVDVFDGHVTLVVVQGGAR